MNDHNIQELLMYFPTVWPLQQAISVNPLQGLTNNSLKQSIKQLNYISDIRGTLSATEYIELYQKQKIVKPMVLSAIIYFIKKQINLSDNDVQKKDLLCEIIFNFIMSRLNTISALHFISPNKNKNQLIAFKLNDYFMDNVSSLITEESLNILNKYTHDKSQSSLLNEWLSVIKYKSNNWYSFINNLNFNDENLIEHLLSRLEIPKTHRKNYLLQLLWVLKGWVGFIKWQNNNLNSPWNVPHIELKDFIVIWLTQELFWLTQKKPFKKIPLPFLFNFNAPCSTNEKWLTHVKNITQTLSNQNASYVNNITMNIMLEDNDVYWIMQHAYELQYQSQLIQKLQNYKDFSTHNNCRPFAQWIFCIDVRSEPFRRLLEQKNNYKTFGFAGFFNFSFSLINETSDKKTLQCPVLISSSLLVKAYSTLTFFGEIEASLQFSINKSKQNLLSPFMMVELLGVFYGLILFYKNLITHSQFRKNIKDRSTLMEIEQTNTIIELNLDTLYQQAKTLLSVISLTQTSNIVIICGHGASTANNPFHSTLDCGACGGNSGISNAIFACRVLNYEKIKKRLINDGFEIHPNTKFIPALHNTTKNTLTLLESPSSMSDKFHKEINTINTDLRQIEIEIQDEKAKQLPGNKNSIIRASDWSETLPEAGLANNASMIIAPRSLTKHINLNGRVFLHEYNYQIDANGDILTSILIAPMIVAHWINMQYYFSSTDPNHYGSGNKVLHNILPQVGVMEGNLSDLKIGLPHQSLFFKDKRLHEPMRLFVLIHCPINLILDIVKHQPTIYSLVKGEWLWLKVINENFEIIEVNDRIA